MQLLDRHGFLEESETKKRVYFHFDSCEKTETLRYLVACKAIPHQHSIGDNVSFVLVTDNGKSFASSVRMVVTNTPSAPKTSIFEMRPSYLKSGTNSPAVEDKDQQPPQKATTSLPFDFRPAYMSQEHKTEAAVTPNRGSSLFDMKPAYTNSTKQANTKSNANVSTRSSETRSNSLFVDVEGLLAERRRHVFAICIALTYLGNGEK